MGSSSMIEYTISNLQKRNPEQLRTMLWSDEWLTVGLEAFHARLSGHKRDAVRQYFEMLEMVSGKGDKALAMWLASVGVTNAELARDMLDMARRAMDAKDDDAYKIAKDLIRAKVQADPDERRRVMQELFGMMDAGVVESPAPVAALNGHANGHANGNGHKNGNGVHA